MHNSSHDKNITITASPFVFLKWLIVIEFLWTFLPILAAVIFNLTDIYNQTAVARSIPYELFSLIVMTSIQVIIIAVVFLSWYLQKYQVNREAIVLKRGDLFEAKTLAQTQTIAGIEVEQGRLAKIFDYGTLVVSSAEQEKKARLKNIPNPAHYAALIEQLIDPQDEAIFQKQKSVAEMIVEGENQYLEFKSSFIWDYRQQRANKALRLPTMKNVAAFMNTTGGVVLIGVDDEGEVLGLDKDFKTQRKPNVDGFENNFNMAFNRMIGAEFRRYLDVVFESIEDKVVCALHVRPSSEPVFLTHNNKESFYIKTGNSTIDLSLSQATSYIVSHFAQ